MKIGPLSGLSRKLFRTFYHDSRIPQEFTTQNIFVAKKGRLYQIMVRIPWKSQTRLKS